MPALIEHGHGLGVLVIFAPKDLQSIQSVCAMLLIVLSVYCVVPLLYALDRPC